MNSRQTSKLMEESGMRTKIGFTLIELLVVIAIIAILAAILFPVFAQARDKARQSACLSNMKQISLAFRIYVDDYDGAGPTFAGDRVYGTNWPWYIWSGLIDAYIPGKKIQGLDRAWSPVWLCPSDASVSAASIWWGGISYGISACLYTANGYPAYNGGKPFMTAGVDQLNSPAQTIYCAEHGKKPPYTGAGQNQIYPVVGPWEIEYEPTFGSLAWHHGGVVNVLFVDGHVKGMQIKQLVGDRRVDHNNTYWNVDDWSKVMR